MKNNKLTTTTLRVLTASCLLALANVSHAEIALGGNNGWEFSSDGSINGFLVNESSDSVPDNTVGGNISGEDSTRVRTGLLPAVLGFNIRSPMIDGIRGNARIGLYPQIQNAGTKNQFGSQIDLREAFFKVEGNFGEVLVGRALNLFQGKNLLTDMTLFGVGVQGGVNGGGTTLGRIGYGYIYANFNAQMRYTTPNMNGLQFSGSIVDPSQIKGDVAATETDMPAFEGELSYASTIGTNKIQGWVNGLWQEASFATGGDVSARGLALGGQLVMDNGLEFLVSGYTGQALGSTLMLDTDSLDSAGEERDNDGFIAQAAYTMGSTKFGLSYGESNADETDADRASGKRHISKQSSTTAGVYHDMNKWLKLVGEYTRAENEWYGDGSNQKADVISVGAFFLW
ncbi:porin [Beggiatoa leptomitoformis]|uniref:Porin n=2 Tax=Beggiatoa leptomitoformis TaxID=288004 RepID=A0A650GDC5_9GAMM|nr:porin [Beggiatoa leptomitoformis]QGX04153.1 porin [Beggiatoa leptomitoformis]